MATARTLATNSRSESSVPAPGREREEDTEMSDNEEDERPDQLFGGARPSTAPATRTLAEPAEPVPVPPTEAMAAASLRPSTAAAASSEAALPPQPPPITAKPSAATGGDELSGALVSACPSFDALRAALAKTDEWQYSPDHRAGKQ